MARKIKVEIIGDSSSAERAFRRSGMAADGFASKAVGAAKLASVALVGFATVGAVKATKAAMDFQASMELLHTQAGVSQKAVDSLSKSVLGMAGSVATTPEVLSTGIYHLASQGLRGAKALDALRTAAEGAKMGQANLEDVTNALGAVIVSNIRGSKNYEQAMGQLNATVGAGDMRMQDLADAMGTGLPAKAAVFGVSLNQVSAALAVFGDNNVRGAAAGTLLNSALRLMGAPSKVAAKALKGVGISSTELADDLRSGGIVKAIADLRQHFKDMGLTASQQAQVLTRAFGGRQAGGVMILMDQFGRLKTKLQEVDRGGKTFADDWESYTHTTAYHLSQVGSAMQGAGITIGTILLPVVSKAANKVGELLQYFTDFMNQNGSFGTKLQALFGDAVAAVDWKAVWGKARGMGAALKAQFDSINWAATGAAIGDGIAAAVEVALRATKGIPSALNDSFQKIDWAAFGVAIGPGLATAILSAFNAVLSPSFWIKNWKLMLAVAINVISLVMPEVWGAKIGKIFAKPIADATLAMAEVISRFAPRLGELFLAMMLRLPGIAATALARLEGVVRKTFGRLGGIAVFTMRVLGIEAAINTVAQFASAVGKKIAQVVNWLDGLPGKVKAVFADAGSLLVGAGKAIVQGLIDGMGSMVGALEQKAKDLVNAAKKKLEVWKSPPDAYGRYIGSQVANGIADGIDSKIASVIAASGRLVNSAKAKMNEAAQYVAKLTAQQTVEQNREQDAQNQAALKAAKTTQERAAALQQIRDTAAQRQLTKAQATYDRLQTAFQNAQTKMQKAQEKANQRMQQLQDQAVAAFDRLSSKIQAGFNASADSYIAPAQQQINAIERADQQTNLEQAVTDAQKAVEDAKKNGGDLLAAQAQLQQAQHDLLINGIGGLADQAAAQQKAHDQEVAAQQDALDQALANLQTGLTKQGMSWDKGLSAILGVINQYVGGFGQAGALLGDAFAQSLQQAAFGAADAGAAVAAANAGGATMPSGGSSVSSSTVVKNYNLNVGQINEIKPNETAQYLRHMEKIGL